MSTVNEDQVRDSLKQCMDPEVPLSIVDMGLIYGIDVTENNDVNIKMTMTTKDVRFMKQWWMMLKDMQKKFLVLIMSM